MDGLFLTAVLPLAAFALLTAGNAFFVAAEFGLVTVDRAEILHVNLRPGDPWVFLNLSDGTSLPALGIQPGIAKERAIADARTLRALAEARSTRDLP